MLCNGPFTPPLSQVSQVRRGVTKPCRPFPSIPIPTSQHLCSSQGGFAGSCGTFLLFPLDAAKTLRQSSPSRYPTLRRSLKALLTHEGRVSLNAHTLRRVYAGVLPTSLLSFPSSFLYFGAYAFSKAVIPSVLPRAEGPPLHAASAAVGNVLSSAVFVPKEAGERGGTPVRKTRPPLWSFFANPPCSQSSNTRRPPP